MINIAIDSTTTRISDPFTSLPGQVLPHTHTHSIPAPPHPLILPRASTASPTSSDARGRGRTSVGEHSSIGSRIRTVAERMRSTSRSGAKSPPNGGGGAAGAGAETYRPAPYETKVHHVPTPSATPVISPVGSPLSMANMVANGSVSAVGSPRSRRGSLNLASAKLVRAKSPLESVNPSIFTGIMGGDDTDEPRTLPVPGTSNESAGDVRRKPSANTAPTTLAASAIKQQQDHQHQQQQQLKANMPPDLQRIYGLQHADDGGAGDAGKERQGHERPRAHGLGRSISAAEEERRSRDMDEEREGEAEMF